MITTQASFEKSELLVLESFELQSCFAHMTFERVGPPLTLLSA